MKRGYTLIELIVSAAIFASVLLMAFTAVTAINRLQRQVRSQRLFFGTTQSVWQTVTQLTRYAQKPASTLRCSYSDAAVSWPATNLTEAITIQNSGRRVFIVAPNMSDSASYRVFVFSLERPTGDLFGFYALRLTANGTSCTADEPAVDLLASANLKLRLNATDSAPFVLTNAPGSSVSGVPQADALLADDAFGRPWMLTIKFNFSRDDASTDEILPVAGQVVSRTPQSVINAP